MRKRLKVKIKVRRLKRFYAWCDNCVHPHAPSELMIYIGGSLLLRIWLCDKCLKKLKDKFKELEVQGEDMAKNSS